MTKSQKNKSAHMTLADGSTVPAVGLGTWKLTHDQAPEVVRAAIEIGYRHIDCACEYGNEPQVGVGIKSAINDGLASRDELWVTSKLWNTDHHPDHVHAACERSLRDLGLNYLDLYLIHFPIAQAYVPMDRRYPAGWFDDPDAPNPRMKFDRVPISETWHAMERLVEAGLVRQIGVCNMGTSLLRDLMNHANMMPSMLQVELHPYLTQNNLVRFCHDHGIAVTGFSPLGAPSYVPLDMAKPDESALNEPTVKTIAQRLSITPAQVLLRWGVQRGTAVIPKTSRLERLRENLAISDVQLAHEDMHAITTLNRHRRFNDPAVFCEDAFNTFCPIFD